MNKIKLFFKNTITNFKIDTRASYLLNTGNFDSYFLYRLKLLFYKLNQEVVFDQPLFLAKAQSIIIKTNPNDRDSLNSNADKLARIKTQFTEIINEHSMILISYIQETDIENLNIDNFFSLVMSSKLPLSWKIKNILPAQKKRIIEQTKEWWFINKNSYDRQIIILLGGLFCDMKILEIKGKDNRENRLKVLKEKITEDAYSDASLRNVTLVKTNRRNLLKDYDVVNSFFNEIGFDIGLEYLEKKKLEIEKSK